MIAPRRHPVAPAIILALLCMTALAVARAGEVELIELQHRPAQELIPLLKPHLETDEALTGRGYQLIVRARGARLQALRDLVQHLDSAPARLRITVRRAGADLRDAAGAELQGDVHLEDGEAAARARGHVYQTERKASDRAAQVVNTLEGQPAFVGAGLAFPTVGVQTRIINGRRIVAQDLDYRQLQSGFYALARVNAGQVTVTVSPKREALSPRGGGMVESSALTTTVRGRLGEWLELGGTGEARNTRSTGIVRKTQTKRHQRDRLWIKVQRLDKNGGKSNGR